MAQSDAALRLIERVARGDRAALAELGQTAGPVLLAQLSALLPDRDSAEAALVDMLVDVWYGAVAIAEDGSDPMASLVALARDHGLARRRGIAPDRAGGMDLADFSDGPAEAAQAAPPGRLAQAVAGLDPGRAAAVRAVWLTGEGYGDLALRLDRTEAEVRRWLAPGLDRLTEAVAPGVPDADDRVAAAEVALGLDISASAAGGRRRPRLAAQVEAARAVWAGEMACAAMALPPVLPSRQVWIGVERRLFPGDRQGLIGRIGLVPALIGALVAALLVVVAAERGVLGSDPATGEATGAAD